MQLTWFTDEGSRARLMSTGPIDVTPIVPTFDQNSNIFLSPPVDNALTV